MKRQTKSILQELHDLKDRLRGIWRGWKAGKIDSFCDHAIGEYIKHINKAVEGKETEQI